MAMELYFVLSLYHFMENFRNSILLQKLMWNLFHLQDEMLVDNYCINLVVIAGWVYIICAYPFFLRKQKVGLLNFLPFSLTP